MSKHLTLTVVVALFVQGCSTTSYTETSKSIILHSGLGGQVNSTYRTYLDISATGKPVIIDGEMISADAFFSFSLPQACYTENAIFAPHAASHLGIIPAPDATDKLTNLLPIPLQDWFRAQPEYYNWLTLARANFQVLSQIWPDGKCEERPSKNKGTRNHLANEKEKLADTK